MVSFQCDVCQDVVKKPKLDAHSYKCHASFTCVDCSKTFWTRSEWKAHTSCISEAEKYQKGLYKGKKAQQNGSSRPRRDKSRPFGSDVTSKSNDERYDPAPSAAESSEPMKSDAIINGTSNTQVSEITTTSAAKEKEIRKEKKKGKADGAHTAPKDDAPPTDGESKKKKKRKLDAADTYGETKIDATIEGEATKQDEPSWKNMTLQGSETKTPREEKRKNKRSSMEDGGPVETSALPATDSRPPALNPAKESDESEPAKKKRKSKDGKPDAHTNEVSPTAEDESESKDPEKKKKRRRRRKKGREEQPLLKSEDDGAAPENDRAEGAESGTKRKRLDKEGDGGTKTAGSKKAKKGKEKRKIKEGFEAEE